MTRLTKKQIDAAARIACGSVLLNKLDLGLYEVEGLEEDQIETITNKIIDKAHKLLKGSNSVYTADELIKHVMDNY